MSERWGWINPFKPLYPEPNRLLPVQNGDVAIGFSTAGTDEHIPARQQLVGAAWMEHGKDILSIGEPSV